LRVAAATTVGDAGFARTERLIDAGVDLVVVDTAHGHSRRGVEGGGGVQGRFNARGGGGGENATGGGGPGLVRCRGGGPQGGGGGRGGACRSSPPSWTGWRWRAPATRR